VIRNISRNNYAILKEYNYMLKKNINTYKDIKNLLYLENTIKILEKE